MSKTSNHSHPKNHPRTLRAWMIYDWANSAHALVIASAIFPVYYGEVTTSSNGSKMVLFFGWSIKNSVLFSYTVAAAFLSIALLIPLLSAIADYSGRKKSFMQFFVYLGACSTASLFFFTKHTLELSVIAFGLSLVGYAGSFVFYNAYLPEIATEDRFDEISAKGYSLGYLGGVVLLLFCLTMLLFPSWYGGISGNLAARLAFLLTGVWWISFAQITFLHLPKSSKKNPGKKQWVANGFIELKKVWLEVQPQMTLKTFLLGFFFTTMGLQTVMYIAAVFGETELKIPGQNLIVVILLIQLLAIAGAQGLSALSTISGNARVLQWAVMAWVGICVSAYFINQTGFYILACLIGVVMGGIQSLARSTYTKLIPEETEDKTSYYGFYDVMDKCATVCGTFSFGLIEHLTGNVRYSIVALAVFFLISLYFFLLIPSRQSYRQLVELEIEKVK